MLILFAPERPISSGSETLAPSKRREINDGERMSFEAAAGDPGGTVAPTGRRTIGVWTR
jgi:hypothetical protein